MTARTALNSAITTACLLCLLAACGSGGSDGPLAVSVDRETVVIRNESHRVLRIAGSVGLEVLEGDSWVDALRRLEDVTGTIVASTLEIRLLNRGEDIRRPIPFYEHLPPGSYRVTVAYSEAKRGSLRGLARASFTK